MIRIIILNKIIKNDDDEMRNKYKICLVHFKLFINILYFYHLKTIFLYIFYNQLLNIIYLFQYYNYFISNLIMLISHHPIIIIFIFYPKINSYFYSYNI